MRLDVIHLERRVAEPAVGVQSHPCALPAGQHPIDHAPTRHTGFLKDRGD